MSRRSGSGIRYIDSLPSAPPEEGYHRIVCTYDDLVPVMWADVPDDVEDPDTMYMSSAAARIMNGNPTPDDLAFVEETEDRPVRPAFGHVSVAVAVLFVCVLMVMYLFGVPIPVLVALALLVLFVVLMMVPVPIGRLRERLALRGRSPDVALDLVSSAVISDGLIDELHSWIGVPDVGWFCHRGWEQAVRLRELSVSAQSVVDDAFLPGSITWQARVSEFRDVVAAVSSNLRAVLEGVRSLEGYSPDRHGVNPTRSQRLAMRDLSKSLCSLLDDNDTLIVQMHKMMRNLRSHRLDGAVAASSRAVADTREVVDSWV